MSHPFYGTGHMKSPPCVYLLSDGTVIGLLTSVSPELASRHSFLRSQPFGSSSSTFIILVSIAAQLPQMERIVTDSPIWCHSANILAYSCCETNQSKHQRGAESSTRQSDVRTLSRVLRVLDEILPAMRRLRLGKMKC